MSIGIGVRSVFGCLAGAASVGRDGRASGGAGSRNGNFRHEARFFSAEARNTVTVGACTFCHTPHRAIQTRLLWNHTLSANTFSWEAGATTTGGTTLPTIATSWEGPSEVLPELPRRQRGDR